MRNESPGISSMSIPRASIMTVSPDKGRIPRNIKGNNFLETLIKGKDGIQVPDKTSKRAKEDSIIDEINKKHLYHLKIRMTTLAVLMKRHVNPMIIQVILMVVQETWTTNIKMNIMKNTVKLHLK